MKTFAVRAMVRKHGDIGIFCDMTFNVAADNLTDVNEKYFEQYGDQWELNHFIGTPQEVTN